MFFYYAMEITIYMFFYYTCKNFNKNILKEYNKLI